MTKVYHFNPTCEMAIGNGTCSYMPPKRLRSFERDIAPLMGFMGQADDILITDEPTDPSFISFWQQGGIDLPAFKPLTSLSEDAKTKYETILPWGWSLAAHRILSPLKSYCQEPFKNSVLFDWQPAHRDFFSRLTSVQFIKSLSPLALHHNFIRIPGTHMVFRSQDMLKQWLGEQKQPVVIKTLWSSSGRGLFLIRNEDEKENALKRAKKCIKQQGCVITESWLNRIQDLSFQFNLHQDGSVEYLGINYFTADAEGHFGQEYIGGLPEEKKAQWEKKLPANWEEEAASMLKDALTQANLQQYYEGPLGIDAMIFQTHEGETCLHPCIEINFRYNMGLVNMIISQKLHPAAKGQWQITHFKPGEWQEFAQAQLLKHPPVIKDGRYIKGFLPLVPVTADRLFGAYALLV
ncbi:ATP-grasp domain-containing protein [Marinilabiliaceae bacterium JC017]|nr:ATP-grasp domain-containing protein [Marinilabiliaceae bacterium JC017]